MDTTLHATVKEHIEARRGGTRPARSGGPRRSLPVSVGGCSTDAADTHVAYLPHGWRGQVPHPLGLLPLSAADFPAYGLGSPQLGVAITVLHLNELANRSAATREARQRMKNFEGTWPV
jgi:hypothetical protein